MKTANFTFGEILYCHGRNMGLCVSSVMGVSVILRERIRLVLPRILITDTPTTEDSHRSMYLWVGILLA